MLYSLVWPAATSVRVEVGLAAGVDESVLELLAEPAGALVLLPLLPHHPITPLPSMRTNDIIKAHRQLQQASYAAAAYSTPFPFMLNLEPLHLQW